MNILVTGGFGNIGLAVVDECLRRAHKVSVFELRSKRTERQARRYRSRGVEVLFGDLRDPDGILAAVEARDAVIHLAAVLPPASDRRPELCDAVNRLGTANLVEAMSRRAARAALVEVSSASVMGPTQGRMPPVRAEDPLAPTDAYSRSKIEAERIVASSRLRHCILRLAAVMPSSLLAAYSSFSPGVASVIFDMPLEARCETVLDLDAAYALVSAAERLAISDELSGLRGFIGGGKELGCQMTIRAMLTGIFEALGLELPDERLFSPRLDSYYLDWYDTSETEAALGYQRHSFDEWRLGIARRYRFLRPAIALFRRPVMKWIGGRAATCSPSMTSSSSG